MSDILCECKTFTLYWTDDKGRLYFEHNKQGDDYAGCVWFDEDKKVFDYDGCFELPNSVLKMLRDKGFNTEEVE